MTTTAGQLLDSLGVKPIALDEGELALEAVVLVKTIDADGQTCMYRVWSPGVDWLARRGLLTAALEIDANSLRSA